MPGIRSRHLCHDAFEHRLHRHLHGLCEVENQHALQQRQLLGLGGVDIQHALEMIGRQTQAQGLAGMQIGVIRVGGQEGIAFGVATPPGEMGFRSRHLHQTQACGLQTQTQALIDPRLAFTQQRIGDAQRQQTTGGLLDTAPRVLQQIIQRATEQRVAAGRQLQLDVVGVGRQIERRGSRRRTQLAARQRLPGQRIGA